MHNHHTPIGPARAAGGLILALVGTLALSGCATLSEEECLNADWRVIGYEDGAKGYAASRIGQHREACSKHNVVPDMQAYRAGRGEGLKEFCRPQNGYRLGLRGRSYAGVCPSTLEPRFVDAYNYGKKIHGVNRRISAKERERKRQAQNLEQTKKTLTNKEAMLVKDNVPATQRLRLLNETKELSKQQGTLESEIKKLDQEIAELQGTVAELKRNSRYQ